MELVAGSIGAVILIVVVIWLLVLSKTVQMDVAAVREEKQEQADTAKALQRDRWMRESRDRIRCLNCDITFDGPLTDAGCPSCHSGALVVSEQEYLQDIRRPDA
jgi:Zn finger protein HypA/HybF involved in hydrogenase expression